MRRGSGWLVWLAGVLLPQGAWAFPEMVRHGYVNCTACHVSTTGGGVLTDYGRELSKELMSTWGREGEQAPLYGVVKPPEWLKLGGDYRSVYFYQDSPTVRQGRSIFMQADLEAAALTRNEKWAFVATLGLQDADAPAGLTTQGQRSAVLSRRHYAIFRPKEEWSVRAGRFMPAFGLNVPDHVIATKRGLSLDEGMESYNIEGAWISEDWNLSATAIFGRPDQSDLSRDQGIAASGSYAFGEYHKVGFSLYRASNRTHGRWILGPNWILGFSPKFYALGELDFQFRAPSAAGSASIPGLFSYLKLGYEVYRGLNAILTQELSRPNLSLVATHSTAWGLGFQWYPRPHFELTGLWQKQKTIALFPDQWIDVGTLLFHYYL